MAQKPDGAEIRRTESYQWPSGHIAHLSDGQQSAFEQFKKLCQQKGYYEPKTGDTPATHDDETLLRYLRARKFLPQEAFKQFSETEDWRRANKLDALYEEIDVAEYDSTRRLYPQWTGRRDKRGIPFYVFDVGAISAKAVAASSKDPNGADRDGKTPWKMLKLFALYENLCRFILPLCSALPGRPHPETPISQSSNIVDLSGVGFTKFWNLRTHMSDASTLATAHYPETLDRIFVVGAPSFFPTVWSYAQRWFDPITVSKIFILSKDNMKSTLEKFVDLENIPKKYGGKLDWQFGDRPHLEPDIVNNLEWKAPVDEKGHRTLPLGPIKWQYDDQGDLVAVAVGTEKGVKRQDVIFALHPDSKVARLALSPGKHDAAADVLRNTAAQSTPRGSKGAGKQNGAAAAPIAAAATTQKTSSDKDAASANDPFTVPYRNGPHNVASPPDGARQGTSHTRFEQQASTHAEGQLEHGTPEVKRDGQGEQHAVVDPHTIGQAPKEHPLPLAEDEAEAPGILSQASTAVGSAAVSVMAAVGLGGSQAEEAAKGEENGSAAKHDPEIDGMDSAKLEEFLRSQSASQHVSEASQG